MSILDGSDAQAQQPESPKSPESTVPGLVPKIDLTQKQTAPIQIPTICTLNFAMMTTPSGMSIVFYNQAPDQNWNLNAPMHSVPVAMVNIAPAQAKDLMLMLMELVPRHEQQFGEITTPYMLEKGLRESSIKP